MNVGLRCHRQAVQSVMHRQCTARQFLQRSGVGRSFDASGHKCYSSVDTPIKDTVNPPESTLAPPLELPERGDSSLPVHLYHVGRTYGRFYWAGVKATWANHKQVRELDGRISRGPANALPRRYLILSPSLEDTCVTELLDGNGITRAEFQALARDRHDWSRVPIFGVLVAIFGEWLPLIVPFMPRVVPKTCRIPKQVQGLREDAEKRRRESFRSGVQAPDESRVADLERAMGRRYQKLLEAQTGASERTERKVNTRLICGDGLARELVQRLSEPELLHVSRSLNLHRRIWDSAGIAPPGFLLKPAMVHRLRYLAIDDTLLVAAPTDSPEKLLRDEELRIACEERGIDVLGRPVDQMRADLRAWLEWRRKDEARGRWLLRMLFRRCVVDHGSFGMMRIAD